MIEIVFETHSTSLDNERGIASGWLDGALSPVGRVQALALGDRHRGSVTAVFTSDLGRAIETVALAFGDTALPKFLDWRLRECNCGDLNGHPSSEVHTRRAEHVTAPYPGGESLTDVVRRIDSFLRDLQATWEGSRVLVVGHSATRYALEHLLAGRPLSQVVAEPSEWQAGWTYLLSQHA
jgi:broad specificity phosphatase PhoE